MLMMMGYMYLCNIMSPKGVFYTVVLIFIVYFSIFTFVLYPAPDFFHLSPETVNRLVEAAPNFQWFIRIGGSWTYASF
jgi:ATP/ADP translocase